MARKNKINPTPVLKAAVDHYGVAAQMDQTIEECAELVLAIRHYQRNRTNNLAEEVADVEIMADQLRLVLGDTLVDQYKEQKITRLAERLSIDLSDQPDMDPRSAVLPGGYLLRPCGLGKVWLQSPDGDGMQVRAGVFAKAMDQLMLEQF